MKPLLMIDVDGPVNAFLMGEAVRQREGFQKRWVLADAATRTPIRELPRDDRKSAKKDRTKVVYPITYDPLIAQRLLSLESHFDLTWATTWNEHANGIIAPMIGLKALDTVMFPQSLIDAEWRDNAECHWKIEGMVVHAGGRPLAWIDDQATTKDQGYLDRLLGSGHSLAMNINPRTGLTEQHVLALKSWAEEHPLNQDNLLAGVDSVDN